MGYEVGCGIVFPTWQMPYPTVTQVGKNLQKSSGIDGNSTPCKDPLTASEDSLSPVAIAKVGIASAENLIQSGSLKPDAWIEAVSPLRTDSERVMAMLPVALFCHEDEELWRLQLDRIAEPLSISAAVKDGMLAVGYAIGRSLVERLDPKTLIGELLRYLQNAQTPFVKQLAIVENLLEEGEGLTAARERLAIAEGNDRKQSAPFALAFYCVLSTLENLQLSTSRAASNPNSAPLTAAIAGALSGAHNSIADIPLAWRMTQLQQSREIVKRAERLLATWSGVYDVEYLPLDSTQFRAVAAPNVIRPWEIHQGRQKTKPSPD